LTLTEGTVKRHLHNIFRILDANNRVEAVNIARERNLLLNLGA
jgi:DNA-binding NarL/FixJ family response regulator